MVEIFMQAQNSTIFKDAFDYPDRWYDTFISVHRETHSQRSDGHRSRTLEEIIKCCFVCILSGVLPDLLTSRLRLNQEPQEIYGKRQMSKCHSFFLFMLMLHAASVVWHCFLILNLFWLFWWHVDVHGPQPISIAFCSYSLLLCYASIC